MQLGILLGLIGAVPALAHAISGRDNGLARCDVYGSPQDAAIEEELKAEKTLAGGKVASRQSLIVDLFIHVVARGPSYDEGNITQQDLDNQLAVLQRTYTSTGVQFNLVGTNWVINQTYADSTSTSALNAMKRALRRGDYRTVNLYIKWDPRSNYGGTCTNPVNGSQIADPVERVAIDGCIVEPKTLPGGSHPVWNLGYTATHEIGHWFGLWHPFETFGIRFPPNPPSGCVGLGDEVEDTPRMREAYSGCRIGLDSCSNDNGTDPIHNYMTYSDDSCMSEFTPGQAERMHMIWNRFRKDA